MIDTTNKKYITISKPMPLNVNDFYPEDVVVIDVETTGLKTRTNQIIEIGAIKTNLRDSSKSDEFFGCFIKCKHKLSPFITKLTGITDHDLSTKGWEFADAIYALKKFTQDLPLVGHNIGFDDKFFRSDSKKACIDYPFSNNIKICTLRMSKSAFPCEPSHKLVDLVEGDQTHRALDDCKMAKELYIRCGKKLGRWQ